MSQTWPSWCKPDDVQIFLGTFCECKGLPRVLAPPEDYLKFEFHFTIIIDKILLIYINKMYIKAPGRFFLFFFWLARIFGFHSPWDTNDNRHVGVPNKRNNQNSLVKSTPTWPSWLQVKTSNTAAVAIKARETRVNLQI